MFFLIGLHINIKQKYLLPLKALEKLARPGCPNVWVVTSGYSGSQVGISCPLASSWFQMGTILKAVEAGTGPLS